MPRFIAVIIEMALFACALWGLLFLSTFLHELGHALGYRNAAGGRHSRMSIAHIPVRRAPTR